MSQKPKFEKQIERLQRIVTELEQGDAALEKSVLLYKEGRAIAAACRDQLEKARHDVVIRDETGISEFPEDSHHSLDREETI